MRTGGLVGWFLPPRPPLLSGGSGPHGRLASDSQDPQMDFNDGHGEDHFHGEGAKRWGGLTYDPFTGIVVDGLDIYMHSNKTDLLSSFIMDGVRTIIISNFKFSFEIVYVQFCSRCRLQFVSKFLEEILAGSVLDHYLPAARLCN